MDKRRHQILGTWIFGSSTFVFLIGVFIFAPSELPIFKQRILAIFSALLAGFFAFFLSGSIVLSGKIKFPVIGIVVIKSAGGIAVFIFMLLWWFSDIAPVKVQGKSTIIPVVSAEDIHLGDNVYPNRWGYNHNPLHISVHPQHANGLVYFDKQTHKYFAGIDNQTRIGQQFVDYIRGVTNDMDFTAYQFISAHDSGMTMPAILEKYIRTGMHDRYVKLGPTILYTNDDNRGNYYERYAAVAVVRAVDFSIPCVKAGFDFREDNIKSVDFLIECYHGGIRQGQGNNFALMVNGKIHQIRTLTENMREKEVVQLSIPLSDINFRQENIIAIYVLPWHEEAPKSLQTDYGPVHFRDVGIINAYFKVSEK